MAAPKGKRPANEAKEIVESVPLTVIAGVPTYNFTPEQRNRVWQLLQTMDASTGRPDAKRKRANKPTPKSARARR